MQIFIEGNIGSGKTTLIKYLKDNLNISVLPEPVDDWKKTVDKEGKNILHYFYKDTKRWSYTFQMNAFITRAQIIQANNDKDFIMERSVYSDKYCFAINCYENGLLNNIEWNLYNSWHKWLTDSLSLGGDAYIYLRTSPEVAYKRIKKRSRDEEMNIPFKYIKEIHDRHDKWLYKRSDNILVIDGNVENSPERLENFKEQIKSFIKKLRILRS